MCMEKYIKIKNFEHYEISDRGNIRNIKTGRILKPRIGKRGYYQLNLRKDNRSYSMKVHRLVAITHLDNPNNLPEVDHIDRNKLNNVVSNLRWTTKETNLRNTVLGKNPYITYNDINNKYLVYYPITHQYFEYSALNDAILKFMSFIV